MLDLASIEVRHKLACVTLVYDSLMGRLDNDYIRSKIVVNNNRRGRRSCYLYTEFHRTNYGRYEPINKAAELFNEVSHVFLRGLSRAGFRRGVIEYYLNN